MKILAFSWSSISSTTRMWAAVGCNSVTVTRRPVKYNMTPNYSDTCLKETFDI